MSEFIKLLVLIIAGLSVAFGSCMLGAWVGMSTGCPVAAVFFGAVGLTFGLTLLANLLDLLA
jgi:hypothetical protein